MMTKLFYARAEGTALKNCNQLLAIKLNISAGLMFFPQIILPEEGKRQFNETR